MISKQVFMLIVDFVLIPCNNSLPMSIPAVVLGKYTIPTSCILPISKMHHSERLLTFTTSSTA